MGTGSATWAPASEPDVAGSFSVTWRFLVGGILISTRPLQRQPNDCEATILGAFRRVIFPAVGSLILSPPREDPKLYCT